MLNKDSVSALAPKVAATAQSELRRTKDGLEAALPKIILLILQLHPDPQPQLLLLVLLQFRGRVSSRRKRNSNPHR